MASVFVYSAGQTAARHFERSIRGGIALTTFRQLLPPDLYAALESAYPDGVCYLWGDRGGEHGRQYWEQIRPGDLALCYQRRRMVAASTVIATIENEPAGLAAWPDAVAEPYRLLFFLSKPQWIDVPVASLPQYFGKVYQGLRRLPSSDQILSDFGTLDRFVSQALLAEGVGARANALPDALTTDQVSEAVRQFDAGREHRFADSTGYDVIVGGKRYPPKAIVGIAAELATGTEYQPDDFSGGLGSKCFRLLEQAGFQIAEKKRSGAWLFQGNPRRFDVDAYLRQNSFIYWGINRYTDDFRLGDPCLIWRAGASAGIVGVGTVAELPKPIADVSHPELLGRELWHDRNDLGNEIEVGIQLHEVRTGESEGFVSRRDFAADPLLAQTALIRFRQGSVFRLSEQEATAAWGLWSQATTARTVERLPNRQDNAVAAPLLPIFDEAGKPIRATCRIRGDERQWEVAIESRGGTLGSPAETNADYAQGFGLIISRLAALNASITDALVDSKKLINSGVTAAERRLQAEEFPYPIDLSVSVADEVTTALRRAQPNVGSDRSSGSGNSTRRVLMKVDLRRLPSESDSVEDYLTGAKSLGLITASDLSADVEGAAFQPTSIVDERKKVIAEIVRRQGSPQFRRLLLEAYAGRCAISGCDAEPALEAAHIVAYLGPKTNTVQNGVLLRADLHTLFDRGLLGIDPAGHCVVLHSSLRGTVYGMFAGERMNLPASLACWPNHDALRSHLVACGLDRLPNNLATG